MLVAGLAIAHRMLMLLMLSLMLLLLSGLWNVWWFVHYMNECVMSSDTLVRRKYIYLFIYLRFMMDSFFLALTHISFFSLFLLFYANFTVFIWCWDLTVKLNKVSFIFPYSLSFVHGEIFLMHALFNKLHTTIKTKIIWNEKKNI